MMFNLRNCNNECACHCVFRKVVKLIPTSYNNIFIHCISRHMGSDLLLVGVIGCGCKCCRQPKFGLELYISINRTFLFLKISHNKKKSTKLKYGYKKFNFHNN